MVETEEPETGAGGASGSISRAGSPSPANHVGTASQKPGRGSPQERGRPFYRGGAAPRPRRQEDVPPIRGLVAGRRGRGSTRGRTPFAARSPVIWDCDRSDYEEPPEAEKLMQEDVAEVVLFDHSNDSNEDIVIVEPKQPSRRRAEKVEPQFHWIADPEPEIYVVFGSEEEDWDRNLPQFNRQRKLAKRGTKVVSIG